MNKMSEKAIDMMNEEKQNPLLDLGQFIGTENWWKHWTGLVTYTDGIKYLAKEAGAYWLIDLVASYQTKQVIKETPFQLWGVKKDEKGGAVVTMREDSGEEPIITQKIDYTDFPFDDFEFYLCDGVILLKSEY